MILQCPIVGYNNSLHSGERGEIACPKRKKTKSKIQKLKKEVSLRRNKLEKNTWSTSHTNKLKSEVTMHSHTASINV